MFSDLIAGGYIVDSNSRSFNSDNLITVSLTVVVVVKIVCNTILRLKGKKR